MCHFVQQWSSLEQLKKLYQSFTTLIIHVSVFCVVYDKKKGFICPSIWNYTGENNHWSHCWFFNREKLCKEFSYFEMRLQWWKGRFFFFLFYKTISLFLRRQRQPTTFQRHQRSCSSGTGFEWISIKGQMLQVWRRKSNSTQRTTQETVRTRTFQRDTWVDTPLLKGFPCTCPRFNLLLVDHPKFYS